MPQQVVIDGLKFTSVSPDSFGFWQVNFISGDHYKFRQILDTAGKRVHRRDRKPLGWELIEAVRTVVPGLTREQERDLLEIRVDC